MNTPMLMLVGKDQHMQCYIIIQYTIQCMYTVIINVIQLITYIPHISCRELNKTQMKIIDLIIKLKQKIKINNDIHAMGLW